MNDEIFSNDFDAKIKTVIQHTMCNLISSNLSANTISFSIFKLKEIRYYNSELDTQYDEEDIITIEKNSYIQDMHFFINQIKNAVAIKKVDQVKIQLFRALKKIALK